MHTSLSSFNSFVAIHQRFDGIILPEHIINVSLKSISSTGWLFFAKEDPTMCNGVKLSSFDYYTKDLRIANHKELRKNGLFMHLNSMLDILVGTGSMDDPAYCIEFICAVYESLHKYCLCYTSVYGYLNCHHWEFNGTTKVCCTHTIIYTSPMIC